MNTRIDLHLSQEEIFFDQIKNPESAQWNVGCNIKLNGMLDITILEKSINCAINTLDISQFKVAQEGIPYLYKDSLGYSDYIKYVDFSGQTTAKEQPPQEKAESFIKKQFDSIFDLFSGKLFEFYIIKLSSVEYWWCSRFHHILVDGYGVSIFCKLVARLYTDIIKGNPIDWLQQEVPHYIEAIEQSHQYVESDQYQIDMTYWNSKFDQLPEYLLNQKGQQDRFVSETLDIEIPDRLRKQIDSCAKENKSSLLQLTLASLITYFSQVSEKSDLVFGIPLHNRLDDKQKHTVGMFTSLVPFLYKTSNQQTVKSLLEEIKNTRRNDFIHQRYPLAHLKRALATKFGQMHDIFDISVNYGKFDYQLMFDELSSEVQQCFSQQESTPLHLFWCDFGKHQPLVLKVMFRLDYMCSEEARFFSERIIYILQQLANNLTELVSNINVISYQEKSLIQSWAKFEDNTDSSALIHELFEKQAEQAPHEIALIYGDLQLSYYQLNCKANQLAHYFIERQVKPDDIVAVCLDRSFDLLVSILAILKAGAAYLPIDPAFPDERLNYMLDDSGVKLVITNNSILDRIEPNNRNILCVDSQIFKAQLTTYSEYNIERISSETRANNLGAVLF